MERVRYGVRSPHTDYVDRKNPVILDWIRTNCIRKASIICQTISVCFNIFQCQSNQIPVVTKSLITLNSYYHREEPNDLLSRNNNTRWCEYIAEHLSYYLILFINSVKISITRPFAIISYVKSTSWNNKLRISYRIDYNTSLFLFLYYRISANYGGLFQNK